MLNDEIYRLTQDIDKLDLKKDSIKYRGYNFQLPSVGTRIDEVIKGKVVEFTFVKVSRKSKTFYNDDSFFAEAVPSSRYKKYMKEKAKENPYAYSDGGSIPAILLLLFITGLLFLVGFLGQV